MLLRTHHDSLGHHSRWWWLTLLALLLFALSHRLEAQAVRVLRSPAPVFMAPSLGSLLVYQWPPGIQVAVFGCTPDRAWCAVRWGDEQGWVQAPVLVWRFSDPAYGEDWPPALMIYRWPHRDDGRHGPHHPYSRDRNDAHRHHDPHARDGDHGPVHHHDSWKDQDRRAPVGRRDPQVPLAGHPGSAAPVDPR